MNSKSKTIARILCIFFKILAFLYISVTLYGLVCLTTGWNVWLSAEGNTLHINYPFTKISFLILDNTMEYWIFSFLLPACLYSIFFCLLSNVFRTFFQDRLFTPENVKQLKRFYLLSLIVPLPVTLMAALIVEVDLGIWLLAGIHVILGVFVYLLAEIFRQGVHLQNEQDLYI